MQIIKKRLKNVLNNKILQNELTPYNIFYIILDPSQRITTSFKKKALTKLLFIKNFNTLKTSSFIYPTYYLGNKNTESLIALYKQLQSHADFSKILIHNIKIKHLIFQNFKLIKLFNIDNDSEIFYKLYILMSALLFNFTIFKNITKLENK